MADPSPEPTPQRPFGLWETAASLVILIAIYGAVLWLTGAGAATRAPVVWIANCVLASLLIALTIIDLRTFLLPDALTLPLIAAGLAWRGVVAGEILWGVLGAVAGYSIVWGLRRVWQRFRGEAGIGLGDAKLLAAGGAWLGLASLPMVLTLASGFGLAVIALARVRQKNNSFEIVAFGPYLALAIWLVWCAGL